MKIPEKIRDYFRQQGRIGGKKRNSTLSPKQRSEIARKAAEARWSRLEPTKEPTKSEGQKSIKKSRDLE